MAELTQTELETKIAAIDAAIDTIVTGLASNSTAAAFVDYSIGNKSVSASQRLAQLRELRKDYQGQLDAYPKEINRVHDHDVERHGEDSTELEVDA